MSAITIDPIFGDFQFIGGVMQMIASNSVQETAQELNARLNFAQGEWFMDQLQGFPYLSAIFVKNPDLNTIARLYRTMFLATPGVDSVTSFTIGFNSPNRKLTWNAQLKHKSGNYIVGGYGQPFIVATVPGQASQ